MEVNDFNSSRSNGERSGMDVNPSNPTESTSENNRKGWDDSVKGNGKPWKEIAHTNEKRKIW
jgi:hypothetical protein